MAEFVIEVRAKTKLKSFGMRHIRVFGSRNPWVWNPESTGRNPRQSWIPLHGGDDRHKFLKHVSKSYDIFRVVCNCREDVVGVT